MKLVKPFTSLKTDANSNTIKYYNKIISTNVTDEVLNEYVAGTYAINSEVKIESLKRRYISKIDNNTDYPVGSINWVDMGALNSFSCFDNQLFSQTTSSSDIIIVLDTSTATKIAFMNLDGVTSITIDYIYNMNTSSVSTVHSLRDYGVNSFYDYLYKPFSDKKQLIADLEWSPSSTSTITISGVAEVKIGMILTGVEESSGLTLWDSEIGQIDYSIINTDAWGNTTFVPRNVAKTVTAKVVINSAEVDTIMNMYDDIKASVNLFIGDERDNGFERLNIVGFIKTVSMSLTPTKTQYPIKIIGVI